MRAIDHVIGCGLVRCDIHRCDRIPKVLAVRQVPVFSDRKRYDRGNTRILRRYDSANGLVHICHIRGRDQIRIRVCEGFDLRFVVLGRLARVHLIGSLRQIRRRGKMNPLTTIGSRFSCAIRIPWSISIAARCAAPSDAAVCPGRWPQSVVAKWVF